MWAIAEAKIWPYAAEVDEGASYRVTWDAEITKIYEGTNQVQRIVMARELLAGRVQVGLRPAPQRATRPLRRGTSSTSAAAASIASSWWGLSS